MKIKFLSLLIVVFFSSTGFAQNYCIDSFRAHRLESFEKGIQLVNSIHPLILRLPRRIRDSIQRALTRSDLKVTVINRVEADQLGFPGDATAAFIHNGKHKPELQELVTRVRNHLEIPEG